jgi:hypothetical protein
MNNITTKDGHFITTIDNNDKVYIDNKWIETSTIAINDVRPVIYNDIALNTVSVDLDSEFYRKTSFKYSADVDESMLNDLLFYLKTRGLDKKELIALFGAALNKIQDED